MGECRRPSSPPGRRRRELLAGAERLNRRAWLRFGQLLLTVGVTWFILDRVGFGLQELSTLGPEWWRPRWVPFLLSCVLLFAGYAVSAGMWGRLVADMGGPRVSFSDSVRLFMVANLGRYIPGKVWQIAGMTALARRRGISAPLAMAAAVLGQGISLTAAVVVGLPTFFGGGGAAGGSGLRILGPAALAVGVLLSPPVFPRVVRLWFRLARQDPPETLGSLHGVRWFSVYLMNWILYAFSFRLLAASFGAGGDGLLVASSFAAAYVLGYLMIFAPAGIGVREGFLVAFLAPVTGTAAASALAIIARVWATLVEIIPAAGFWVGEMRRRPGEGQGGGHA